MRKINFKTNQTLIILAVLFLIVIFPDFAFSKDQFDPPYVHGYVFGEKNDLTAVITWESENQEEYGYKIEKEGNDKKITAAIFNPVMLGVNPTPQGLYLDQGISENERLTYIVNYFDRAGNEGELGRIDLRITSGLIKLSLADIQNKKGNLTLNWQPVEEAKSYEVFRDNDLLGKTTKTEFRDKKTLDGMHQYEIQAYSEENDTSGLFKKAHAQNREISSYNISLETEKGNIINNYLLYILVLSGAVLTVLFSFKLKKKQ